MDKLSIVNLPAASPVWSLRQSRAVAAKTDASACLRALGREVPAKPNALTGTVDASCGWLEPHAWILTGAPSGTSVPAGFLLTDISDRVAQFAVTGTAAIELIAAGCDPRMVVPGAMARTRFGGVANVIVQRWSENDYRLMVDVSIAAAFAAWLADAAAAL